MCVPYVEPCPPQIPSEQQQQAKGFPCPEREGERWKLCVVSGSSEMRCRPLSPILGTHTPSPTVSFDGDSLTASLPPLLVGPVE